jgi:hypothetical protein
LVLIPLNFPQFALGQTITTENLQYSSAALTLYSTSQLTATTTQPLRYRLTPPGYSYQTGSFLIGQTEFTTRSGEDYPCLFFDYFLLNATAGQEIRGHFTLGMQGRAVYFFILNQEQLRRFLGLNCAYGWDGSSELSVFASSYDLDWVVPVSGVYALLFVSTTFYGGPIYFTAQAYSTTIQNSTQTYTTTTTSTLESSQIALSTISTQNVTSQSPPSTGSLVPFIAIVMIGLVICVAILMRKRKKESKLVRSS